MSRQDIDLWTSTNYNELYSSTLQIPSELAEPSSYPGIYFHVLKQMKHEQEEEDNDHKWRIGSIIAPPSRRNQNNTQWSTPELLNQYPPGIYFHMMRQMKHGSEKAEGTRSESEAEAYGLSHKGERR